MKKFFNAYFGVILKIVFEILALATIIFVLVTGYSFGYAEEDYTEAYVLCTPNDYVNVRPSPSTKGESLGYLYCGYKVYLDGKSRNGFLHCVNMSLERDNGWVYKGYIVYDEPEFLNQSATIVSKGRLAARKYIDGKRTRWLKPMATLKVYYWTDEWAITNCGYVRSQYLELDGE